MGLIESLAGRVGRVLALPALHNLFVRLWWCVPHTLGQNAQRQAALALRGWHCEGI